MTSFMQADSFDHPGHTTPLVGGPLNGQTRTHLCPCEVEVVTHPCLFFDSQTLSESVPVEESDLNKSYLVYRLERSSSDWEYVFDNLTTQTDIAKQDRKRQIRGIISLLCFCLILFVTATVVLSFVIAASQSRKRPLQQIDWGWRINSSH